MFWRNEIRENNAVYYERKRRESIQRGRYGVDEGQSVDERRTTKYLSLEVRWDECYQGEEAEVIKKY